MSVRAILGVHGALLCLLVAGIRAQAQRTESPAKLPTRPILRVEAGAHSAVIWHIGVDRASRYVVTGSDDKTLRVWSLADRRLLRTLRPPIGDDDKGQILAAAITPDGKIVAGAGDTGREWDGGVSIYLFDRESGTLIRRIRGLPGAVCDLSFSPDGRFLAAGLAGKNGVRVFATADGRAVMADSGYEGDVQGTDWDSGGRLVTSASDDAIRMYSAAPELKPIFKVGTPKGSAPAAVRFAPDGARIAVGYQNSRDLSVLSGSDLSVLYRPDLTGVPPGGTLFTACWSPDGKTLYAAGSAGDPSGQRFIRQWADGGRGPFRDTEVGINGIKDIRTIASGVGSQGAVLAYSTNAPTWGVLGENGNDTLVGQKCPTANFVAFGNDLGVSHDGTLIAFQFARSEDAASRFSVTDRSLTAVGLGIPPLVDRPDSIKPPMVEADGVVVSYKMTKAPTVNGIPLAINQYDGYGSLAIERDKKTFLLGSKSYLGCFDVYGTLRWSRVAPSVLRQVNVTENGKLGVAAYADGTIRWYRMTDGKELLDFFAHADKKRWMLWTPDGYYDCSSGGEDLIGWQINRGKDRAADFYPASRFRDTYYRPDVIQQVLKTLDPTESLRIADAAAGRAPSATRDTIENRLPPVVRILSSGDNPVPSGGKVTIRFLVEAPDNAPVTSVRALVDGRPPQSMRGLDFSSAHSAALPAKTAEGSEIREIVVPVPAKECDVSIVAENKNSASVPATMHLQAAATLSAKAGSAESSALPRLFALAIGVGAYADTKDVPQLQFAAKDARDFATALKAHGGHLYSSIEVKLLTDAGATRDDVEDGLEWIKTRTTSRDVAMVFLSGHGDNDASGSYCFLPQNFDPAKWKRTAVSYADIQLTLRNIAGKALLFVDTCHSGNVDGSTAAHRGGELDINRVANSLSSAENGVVVFTASTGRQYALENTTWGNGAFTKALVEGMTGKADYGHNGQITVNMLDLYISERVKELTGGRQSPATAKPDTIADFPLTELH